MQRPHRPLLALTLMLLAATLLWLAPAARANTATAQSDALRTVKEIETYLQGLHTIKARFVQTGPDGTQIGGDFLLKRPGRMRFDYDEPVKDFIVADGTFVYYYDGQLRETASAPIDRTLANFFLQRQLTLSGDVRVTDVTRENDLIMVSLVQAKDAGAGTLMIGFSEAPLQLKKWRIIDVQGLTTEVTLAAMQTGIRLDNKHFHYYDPRRREGGYN